MPLTPFADGPGNTASGVAVYNNDLYLEALANAKEAAFSTWKSILNGASQPGSGNVTLGSTYVMPPSVGGPAGVTATGTGAYSFYLDPADWLAGTRQTKLRIRWHMSVNAVAPGTNLTAGLYQVLTYSGASGVALAIATVSAPITGSTVTFTTPGAGTNSAVVSTEFNAPAAGDYVLGFATGGAFAAGSQTVLRAELQYRQV